MDRFFLVMLYVGVCCNVASVLCSLWSPVGKGLTSRLSCVLCFVTFPNVSWSTSESWCHETGLSSQVKYFTGRSKVVLLSWIICLFCVLCFSCFSVCSLLPYGHLLGKG